jgi:hypothetical protein
LAQQNIPEVSTSAGLVDQIYMTHSPQNEAQERQIDRRDVVLRTTMAKGNDPLNLLFEAVPKPGDERQVDPNNSQK